MAETVYVIRNQQGQYWIRAGEWVDGREPKRVLRLKHRDEAVNQLVELSAKDIDLRGEILPVEPDERGDIQLEPSAELTPTLAEKAATEAAARAAREAEAQSAESAETTEAQAEGDAAAQGSDVEEPASSAAV